MLEEMSVPNGKPLADTPGVSYERLPNEILHHIFNYLDTPPPSANLETLRDEPNFDITKSENASLKAVSLTSKLWRSVSVPMLFKYSQFNVPKDGSPDRRLSQTMKPFFDFVTSNSLKTITSFTLICHDKKVTDNPASNHWDYHSADFWKLLFQVIDPVDLLIVAAPEALGRLTSCPVYIPGEGVFEFECHYLRLQRATSEMHQSGVSPDRDPKAINEYEAETNNVVQPEATTLFSIRPWEKLLLNEGSFIKAYADVDFGHKRYQSILSDLIGYQNQPNKPLINPTIRDMSYIAMFPANKHFWILTNNLPRLDRLYTQVVPPNQVLKDVHKMANIRQEDLWMERNKCYALLMRELFSSPAPGNYRYLKVMESGDQADRRPWEMAANFISHRMREWKVEGDGVLMKDLKIHESKKALQDKEKAPTTVFDADLVKWAFRSTANLPVSTQLMYRNNAWW